MDISTQAGKQEDRPICSMCKKPHFAGEFICINCSSFERAIERNRFRKIIQDYLDGNHVQTRKYDKCKHDRYGYEVCDLCVDDYFTKALETL